MHPLKIHDFHGAPHWKEYENAVQQVPLVIAAMTKALEGYVDHECRKIPPQGVEISSTMACSEVLNHSPDAAVWVNKFGSDVDGMLGKVLWVVMFDDLRWWETKKPKKGKLYKLDS